MYCAIRDYGRRTVSIQCSTGTLEEVNVGPKSRLRRLRRALVVRTLSSVYRTAATTRYLVSKTCEGNAKIVTTVHW